MSDSELISTLNSLGVSGDVNIVSGSPDAAAGLTSGIAAAIIALGIIAIIGLILLLVFGVLEVIGRWRIVKRLGGHGWSQLIPVYCEWEMSKVVGLSRNFCVAITAVSGAMVLCACGRNYEMLHNLGYVAGIAGLVLSCVMLHKLSRVYGHGCGYVVGLLLLPGIFYLLLGCSSKEIEAPVKFDEDKPEAPAEA